MLLLAVACMASGADAQPDEADQLQIHGFVSQGYIKTTRNNYLGPTARAQGSFEFSEVGVNFTKPIGDRLRVAMQIFAHDLGPLGKYAPQLDWYFLDYRFFDWLGLRAGKTKLPWGLYNESNDIDSGRVPILLPQSLYAVSNRDYLFAQTGGELYGNIELGQAGTLEYRAYGGTMFINPQDASQQLRDFSVPYDAGGRLMWQAPVEGLQLGGSVQFLRFDFDFAPTPDQRAQYEMAGQLPAGSTGDITARLPAMLWVGSVEYQHERLLLAAEYGQQRFKYHTNLLLPQTNITNQAGYLMASYQVNNWFTPGVYYSALFPNTNAPKVDGAPAHPRSSYQHDVAATLRYDINSNWLVKVEGHYMHGTAGLQMALNGNQSLNALTKDWGVFLVKTTAYF
jgi:hypothetical protein